MTISFSIPTRLIFENGAIDQVGRLAAEHAERVVIVAGKSSARKQGWIARIKDGLRKAGIDLVGTFEGIDSDPSTDAIDTLASQVRFSGAETVIGIGGGSVLDAAKAAARLAVHDGSCIQYFNNHLTFEKPGLGFIAIPTTSGTGSETNAISVLIDPETKIKRAFIGATARYAIIDPETNLSMSPKTTAYTGIDALTHAVEALASKFANPPTIALSLESIRLVGQHLSAAYAKGNNLEARTGMCWASYLAGTAFSSAGLGLCHALAHPLGSYFNVEHGLSNAVFLPAVMEFNLEPAGYLFARMAFTLGLESTAGKAIEFVEKLIHKFEMDRRLSDFGVTENDLPTIARGIEYSRAVQANPRPVSLEQALEVSSKLL